MAQLFNKLSGQFEEVSDDQAEDLKSSGEYLEPEETIEVFNTQTNQPEFVAYDEAPQKVLAQTHQFLSGTKIPFLNDLGETELVEPESAYDKINAGAMPSSYKQFSKEELERKRGTPGQMAISALEGSARGATLGLGAEGVVGLARKGIESTGGKAPEWMGDYIQAAEEREAVNPIISGTAEFATPFVGLGMAAKGAKVAKFLPSNALFSVGEKLGYGAEKAAQKMLGKKVSERALKGIAGASNFATQATLDGAVINANKQMKDYVNHDKDFSAESFIGNTAISTLFGSVVGAASPYAKDYITKQANSFNRLKSFIGEDKIIQDLPARDALAGMKADESKFAPGKYGFTFKKNSKLDNIYVLEQGNKKVVINKADIIDRLIDYDNPIELKDFVLKNNGNSDVLQLIPDELYKTDLWNSMRMADFYGETPLNSTINHLSQFKETKELSNILARKQNVLARLESISEVPLEGIVEKEPISQALKDEAKEVFEKYLDILQKTKPTEESKPIVEFLKSNFKKSKEIIDQKVEEKFGNIIGHIEGGDVVIHSKRGLPEDAVLRNFKVYSTKTKQTPADLNALLRQMGAKDKHLKYFKNRFNEEEKKKILTYLEDKIKQSGDIIPDVHSIEEALLNDNKLALDARESALNKMANAVLGKYGNVGIRDMGLHSSKISNYIEKQIIPELYEKGILRPGMGRAETILKEYSDFYKNLDTKMTPIEWIKARQDIDQQIGRSFIKDYGSVPFGKQKLWDLRHFMEDELENVVRKKIPERSDLLKEYQDAKFMYRITHDSDRGESLFTIARDSSDKEAARWNISAPKLIRSALSAGAGYSLGGIPGTIAGIAAENLITGPLVKSSPYFEYQYFKKVYPKLEKSFKFIDQSSKEFAKGVRAANIGAQEIALDNKDVDFVLKNRSKIESAYNNPINFIQMVSEKNPDAEIFSPELGAKIAKVGQAAMNLIYEKMPKNPYPDDPSFEWRPDPIEMAKFKRYVTAVLKPETIFENFGNGYVSQEEIETLKKVYPTTYLMLKRKVFERTYNKKLNYQQQELIKKVFGNEMGNYKFPKSIYYKPEQLEEDPQTLKQSNKQFSGQEPTKAQKIEAR